MYFLIGISLLFVYLYAVNLLASVFATAAWRLLSRRTEGWSGRLRANVIFLLRVLPFSAAIILSFAYLIPSFLLFEPHESDETVGYKLALIVGVSIVGIVAAALRIFASWWRTRQLTARWLKDAEPVSIGGGSLQAFKIRHPFPVLAVVGAFRPRIFVAEQVLDELNESELEAALSHELGHVSGRDNFKRIAIRLCGDLLVLPVGTTLDRLWLEAAESAADEFAAETGPRSHALDLASALVKIGRITPSGKAWELPIGAYLTEPDDTSIASRVDGLLRLADTPAARSQNTFQKLLWLAPFPILAALMLPAFNANVLYTVHRLTEAVVATLE